MADAYQELKARYASISHTLTVPERQQYRRQLYRLNGYFTGPAFVRAAATLAMARASHVSAHIAAVITHRPGIRR